MNPTTNGTQSENVDLRSLVLLAFSATAGVLVEFYDFFIFGYAAASVFPETFFPDLSPTTALVFSYLTFGAGFPARLLGAFIFGHFGDRAGRKVSFLLNIVIVGTTTLLVGVLPSYQSIGALAPIVLITLRIVQGIGLGGEFGGASSLLSEFGSTHKNRAFWISLANLGIPGGAMLASAVLYILADNFATYGWRVAMGLSVLIVIPALIARHKLADSPLFERLKEKEELAKMPSLDVIRAHGRPILLLALIAAFQQMDGYVSGTYIISFMKSAGIPIATIAVIIFVSRIGDVIGVALSGPLADLLKRKPLAYLAIGLTAVLCYPYALAILHGNVVLILALQFLITLTGVGILHGLAPIVTSESFPTKYRYSGAGISYSLSAMLGGMIAPSLLAALIGEDVATKWLYIPLVYLAYAIVAALALLFVRETRNISLEQLDTSPAWRKGELAPSLFENWDRSGSPLAANMIHISDVDATAAEPDGQDRPKDPAPSVRSDGGMRADHAQRSPNVEAGRAKSNFVR